MIIVTREYEVYSDDDEFEDETRTEFRVFGDDEVARLQAYLDLHDGTYTFQKL